MNTVVNLPIDSFNRLRLGEDIITFVVEDNSWAVTIAKEGEKIEVRNGNDYLLAVVAMREDKSIDDDRKAIRLIIRR